jgi:hypothetical protein
VALDGTDLRDTRRELENALIDALARDETDPAALKRSAQLGAVLAEIGNRYEARRCFRRVVSAGPAVLGADHPLIGQAETYLAAAATAAAVAATPAQRRETRSGAPAIHPAGRELQRTGSPRVPAPVRQERPPSGRTRRKSLIWAVGASAAFAAAIAAGAALWTHGNSVSPAPPAGRKPSSKPILAPQHVTVTIADGVVTVKWQDPSRGTVPFIVSGGLAGATADVRQQVSAGQTAVSINGLNNSRDYCFSVVAVYSADQVAVSDLTCTRH